MDAQFNVIFARFQNSISTLTFTGAMNVIMICAASVEMHLKDGVQMSVVKDICLSRHQEYPRSTRIGQLQDVIDAQSQDFIIKAIFIDAISAIMMFAKIVIQR